MYGSLSSRRDEINNVILPYYFRSTYCKSRNLKTLNTFHTCISHPLLSPSFPPFLPPFLPPSLPPFMLHLLYAQGQNVSTHKSSLTHPLNGSGRVDYYDLGGNSAAAGSPSSSVHPTAGYSKVRAADGLLPAGSSGSRIAHVRSRAGEGPSP